MGRSRDKNSEENLRGHLRQLKSENKQLRRQITRLEKQLARQPIDSIEEPTEAEEYYTPTPKYTCPKCGKEAQVIDLVVKKVLSCKSCNHRSAYKK